MGKSRKSLLAKVFAVPKLLYKKFKKLDRNIQLSAVLVFVLLFVGLWATLFNSATPESGEQLAIEETQVEEIDTAEEMMASITYTQGVVEFKDDLGEWTDAESDMQVMKNNGVRTRGAAARTIITLEDGSELRVGPNSEIHVDELTQSRVIVRQIDGQSYSRVTESEDRTYEIATENANFQAVSTAFRTIASGDEEAVEAFESTVQETQRNERVVEGKKYVVKNFVNPDRDETFEDLDIEILKEDEFITWNRERDRQNDTFKDQLGYLSDFDGPEINITDPKRGSTVEVPADKSNGTINIKGTTERGSKLTVESKSLRDGKVKEVTVKDDGSFETGDLQAPVGNSVFEFIATDRRGNKTTLNVTYVFKKSSGTQEFGISLDVDATDINNPTFSWSYLGLTAPDGVKLIYDKVSGATFPAVKGESVPSGTSTTFDTTGLERGTTYYFRVCRYINEGATCDNYSNEVTVDIPSP
jgi:hypothetical protein